MCELCDLIEAIGRRKSTEEVLYVNPIFICVYCIHHPDTPMAVLRRHATEASKEETDHIFRRMNQMYPKRKPRGIGMMNVPDHWHEHWIER